MTRVSQVALHNRALMFWYMECDKCQITRSKPEWSQAELPLDRFRAEGWQCRLLQPMDICPKCLEGE